MIIRKAIESDLEGLLKLYAQLNPEDPVLTCDKALTTWKNILSSSFSVCFVAIDNNEIISTCSISIIPNLTRGARPFAVIENVVTDMNHRNRGCGRKVIEAATEHAKKSNCYKVVLLSSVRRTEAHAFYEHLGFDGNSKKGFELRLL